ncbi:sugar-binding domain-containing protein [uncultured Parabacteroides sp.]|jgi:beta-galactosidase|uniref:sugar-binding domain-containing protein n=1 Tax=uncultured Parabacteroides sp. TaxID=512312 RepID=UPI0025FE73FF|nr:sugar-binding domain-containing protein [uncultured Parabacteroides sp.]
MKKIIYYILLLFSLPLFLAAQNPERISLTGDWRFALDSADVGEKELWYTKTLVNKIKLPGITDEGGYGEDVIETGKLSRLHKYIGKAWYQMDITIPKNWKNKNVSLFFERVMWKSQLWLNDKYIDSRESLLTPHCYSLGKLSPGTYTLTLCIDNREIYPIGNEWGHSYGDQTQIIWNGIIGKMEMSSHPDVQIELVRTFPDDTGKLDVEVSVLNRTEKKQKLELFFELKDRKTGTVVDELHSDYLASSGKNVIVKTLKVSDPDLWDEFSPSLYELTCSAKSKFGKDAYEPVIFGFRSIGRTDDYITVNGLKRYLRGNLDCAVFPLTGYPATDKESWLRIFQAYKDYGLNHVRFHSWTPPKAAFEAADELGLYVLSEIFWRDGWMGKALDIEEVEPFLRPELRRIADAYGNHPSLVMLAMGNELGGFDRNKLDPWIKEVKEHDPRHFYTASVRRPVTTNSDINFQGDLSSPYPLLFINEGRLSTNWDYAPWYGDASPLPSIQHEVGQWVFYPDWNEVNKYTGNLRARSMESYRELAWQRGVYEQNKEFILSSGFQSMALYKENIESLLRTPYCGGFQLLSIQDFPGQGVALIGWLDSFYDNKGIVTPERFKNWCNTTVPLMRTPSYIYTSADTLKIGIEVLHFADKDIKNAQIDWRIRNDDGYVWDKGTFDHYDIKNATLNKVGQLSVSLAKIDRSQKLLLEVSVRGTVFKNDWHLWVFCKQKEVKNNFVIETTSVTDALEYLKAGKTVILWAHQLGSSKNAGYAQWKPTFWQAGNQGNEGFTNGAVIRNTHPALKDFPTDNYLDFQWFDICKGGRGFDLDGLPHTIRPIVQPIHDFHFNRKLGAVMEFAGREGGKILICGYNLVDSLEKRPAAQALKNSLMQYVSSSDFQPRESIDYDWMKRELYDINAPYLAPGEFEKAYLYVKAGGRLEQNGTTEWALEKDASTFYETDKYGYRVHCDHIIVNESFSAWQGKKIQLDLKIPFDFSGEIKLLLCNPDEKERKGTLFFNGKETVFDSIPQKGKWITLRMNPGESLLGNISIALSSLCDESLLIGEIAIMPKH